MCDCQNGVRNINFNEKIKELLEAADDGMITAKHVIEANNSLKTFEINQNINK